MARFDAISKSRQFYDFLKAGIIGGEYPPGAKYPSIRELAERYDISKITVNSVISRLVAEGLLQVEQGRGTFVSAGKPAAGARRKMIGVMMFDFSRESEVEIDMFNSIQAHLPEDYFVIPYNSYDQNELFYKGLRGFIAMGVDGVILVPPSAEDGDPDLVRRILGPDLPVVQINRRIPGLAGDFLAMDFGRAAYEATRHLIGLGRRHILLVRHSSPSIIGLQQAGYERALAEAGLPADSRMSVTWLRPLGNEEEVLAACIDRIDGLVASDVFVYKARKLIEARGRRIPYDMNVVGINNTAYARFMHPPISSIPFPAQEIGQAAIEFLQARIANPQRPPVERLFFRAMVDRSS